MAFFTPIIEQAKKNIEKLEELESALVASAEVCRLMEVPATAAHIDRAVEVLRRTINDERRKLKAFRTAISA